MHSTILMRRYNNVPQTIKYAVINFSTTTSNNNLIHHCQQQLQRRFIRNILFLQSSDANSVSSSVATATTYFLQCRANQFIRTGTMRNIWQQQQQQQHRLFTTSSNNNNSSSTAKISRKQKRKRKNNSNSSHNSNNTLSTTTRKSVTTKDRLRLSVRPSSSSSSGKKKKNSMNRMITKSPEELIERFNTGLNYARIAVRETYAALRNPTSTTNDNSNSHLLSAREAGEISATQKGLVMDENWWFWNLMFAASPSFLIFLYCELIVKPEMKKRNEECEKNKNNNNAATTTAVAVTVQEVEKQQQDKKLSLNANEDDSDQKSNVTELSPMQKRQQHRQEKQQQETSDISLSPNSCDNDTENDKLLWSYFQRLFFYFDKPKLSSLPLSQNDGSGRNNDEKRYVHDDSSSSSKNTVIQHPQQLQTNRQEEQTIQLNIKQRELNELQSRLQMLRDQINKQQQQQQDKFKAASDDNGNISSQKQNVSSDETNDKSSSTDSNSNRKSTLKMSEKTATVATTVRGDWLFPLISWWRGFHHQLSDQNHENTKIDSIEKSSNNKNANSIGKVEKMSSTLSTTILSEQTGVVGNDSAGGGGCD